MCLAKEMASAGIFLELMQGVAPTLQEAREKCERQVPERTQTAPVAASQRYRCAARTTRPSRRRSSTWQMLRAARALRPHQQLPTSARGLSYGCKRRRHLARVEKCEQQEALSAPKWLETSASPWNASALLPVSA